MKTVLTAVCLATVCGQLIAADWLQFRGPGGTGISPEANLPVQLDAKSITWKIALHGRGRFRRRGRTSCSARPANRVSRLRGVAVGCAWPASGSGAE